MALAASLLAYLQLANWQINQPRLAFSELASSVVSPRMELPCLSDKTMGEMNLSFSLHKKEAFY